MLIYILVALFLLFVLYKERRDLGCPDNPIMTSCINTDIRIVKETKPDPSDSTPTLFRKIEKAANFAEGWVTWRLSVIIATTIILGGCYIIYQRGPTEWELVVGILVGTIAVYFGINFYLYHYVGKIAENVDAAVDDLRGRVGPR